MPPIALVPTHQRQYLQRVSGLFKAEVYISSLEDGTKIVCKDYSRFENQFFARVIARYLVNREQKVLQQLNSWEYSPKVFRSSHNLVLVQEYIKGKSVIRGSAEHPEAFERLERALAELHSFGIAHNDIHADNVILRSSGQPVLIDFASATSLPNFPGLEWIEKKLFSYDVRHMVKIKQRSGLALQPHEQASLHRSKSLELLLKVWKSSILPALKFIFKG